MSLQAADTHEAAARHHLHLVAHADRAVGQRAGHHGAEAAHGEHAVDGQPRPAGVLPCDRALEHRVERGQKLRDAFAGQPGNRHGRRSAQACVRDRAHDLSANQVEPLGVDEVRLGEDDDPVFHVEQVEDLEVLARLGHHALVGRDDEERRVEAMGPGEHVAHEARVAWHVDDADLAPARERHVRESEVDGHAAALLFGEAVRVDAGESRDERGFAVVDVARGADDEAHRLTWLAAASTASIRISSSPLRTVRGSRQHWSFSMRAITGGSPRRSAAASRDAGPVIESNTVAI